MPSIVLGIGKKMTALNLGENLTYLAQHSQKMSMFGLSAAINLK